MFCLVNSVVIGILASVIFLSVVLCSQVLPDDTDGILMSLVTADIEVTHNDVALCKSFKLPVDGSFSFVEFMPHPIPAFEHHFNVYLCKEPGLQAPSSLETDQFVWNCFGDEFGYQPELPNGTICDAQGMVPMFASFDMNEKTTHLKLPDGFGFRAGSETGFNYVVMATHYPEFKHMINGRTGHSEVTMRLLPEEADKKTKRLGVFNLSAWGFIPASSVTSMNGSYVYDQSIPMQAIAVLAHTHARGLDFEMWRTTADGQNELVWKQDPNKEIFFHIPDHPLPTISDGDTLTLRCVFNNTSPETLVIETEEMCSVLIIYAVDGEELISDPFIVTIPIQFEDSFPKSDPGWKFVYYGQ